MALRGFRELNRRLFQKLEWVTNRRLTRETEYVKDYLFSLIPEERRFSPLPENMNTELVFVPSEREDGGAAVENIREMVEAIRSAGGDGASIELYIDMQGGNRTDGYVRSAVLSILENEFGSRFKIRQVIATNFMRENFSNEIVDETLRYSITDLVSGMNAFIRYGKAAQLQEYFRETKQNYKKLNALLDAMASIDKSITSCDIHRMEEGIKKLKDSLRKKNQGPADRNAEIFSVLEEGIRRDYGSLLDTDESINYIDLIRWALRKDFFQQALTVVEAKLPEQLVSRGILYYPKEQESRLENYRHYKADTYPYIFAKSYLLAYVLGWRKPQGKLPREKETKIPLLLPLEVPLSDKTSVGISFSATPESVSALLLTYNQLADMRNSLNHASADKNRAKPETIVKKIRQLFDEYDVVAKETEEAGGNA